MKIYSFLLIIALPAILGFHKQVQQQTFIEYRIDPKKHAIKLYWKDDKNQPFRSIKSLKDWLESKGQRLVFAMNGGMYKTDNSPLGLYIENSKLLSRLNTRSAGGNFYMKPNGVFYILSNGQAAVTSTEKFKSDPKIQYATQSGPMLVIDGKIHPSFTAGSKNLNIRNGVGILANGDILFAMSKGGVNFYDFANYFKKAGCKNALYLDGFVSRTYLPEQNVAHTDGNFGVIIAEAVPK